MAMHLRRLNHIGSLLAAAHEADVHVLIESLWLVVQCISLPQALKGLVVADDKVTCVQHLSCIVTA